MFQTDITEKIKTHILCSITFFPRKPCRYEMCKKTAEPGRPQMKIWRMSIACWILMATKTYSTCVILIAFPLQKWLHKRAWMLRHTYAVCLRFSSCDLCDSENVRRTHRFWRGLSFTFPIISTVHV